MFCYGGPNRLDIRCNGDGENGQTLERSKGFPDWSQMGWKRKRGSNKTSRLVSYLTGRIEFWDEEG